MTGLESCKRAQEQHLRAIQEAMTVATDHAATLLFEEMYAETSLVDHSLEDLRKMGHPYRQGAPQGVPHPDWLVHHQSGDLQEGLSRTPVQVNGSTAQVEFHSAVEYTWFLLLGTRYMRPRDFVSASLYKARGAIQNTYEFYFKNTLDVKKGERYQAEVIPIFHDQFDPQLPSR